MRKFAKPPKRSKRRKRRRRKKDRKRILALLEKKIADSDDEDHGSRDILKKRKSHNEYSELIQKKTKLENYQKAIDQAV